MVQYYLYNSILSLLILSGCSNDDSQSAIKEKKHLADSQVVKPLTDTLTLMFDHQKPFEVILQGNRIEQNTTDKDTLKCNNWTLTEIQVAGIIKNSQIIDGTHWDLAFDYLACSVFGYFIQDNLKYPFTINAGSYALVNSGDTTIIYGDFVKNHKRFFLSSPQQ